MNTDTPVIEADTPVIGFTRGDAMSSVRGIVLAAGLGSRLRPLSARRPKPLVPVAGRPLCTYAIDALAKIGAVEVGLNAHHLGHALPVALKDRPERLHFVFEEVLQGTGGGVRGVAAALPGHGTIAVVNGDALLGFDLAPLLAEHRRSGAIATLVLREVPPDAPFGRVGVDARGRLHRIAEVEGPDATAHTLRYGAFTGVQFIEQALINAIPGTGECDILRSAYRAQMNARGLVRGIFAPTGCDWIDVGTLDRYHAAHRAILDGAFTAHHLPPADAAGVRRHPGAQIAPSARLIGPCAVLEGAQIGPEAVVGPYAFIDRDAVVLAKAEVSDVVLWAGATATGSCRGEVLLD